MKTTNLFFFVSGLFIVWAPRSRAATAPPVDPSAVPVPASYEVVERGEDFAVHTRVSYEIDGAGKVQARTNQFTVLDHGMHYFEAGQWKESQDFLEPFSEGAIARFGAYITMLGNDISAPAVFEIIGADGQRIRGGPRTIQLTDVASGKSLLLGEVTSAAGRIIPPNRVIYPNLDLHEFCASWRPVHPGLL